MIDDSMTLGEAIARELYPETEITIPSITEVIEEVIADPSDYCDEYVAACVRTQAATVAVTTANGFWEEAEATVAYAATVARLKKFW